MNRLHHADDEELQDMIGQVLEETFEEELELSNLGFENIILQDFWRAKRAV